MRALRYYGREDVRIDEVDEPVPSDGEVLVEVAFNGLCGSDVHEYFGGPFTTSDVPHPLTGCALPAILGHEFSGIVTSTGPGVEDLEPGSRVAIEPIETCGRCSRCLAGTRHLCRRIAFHGYTRAGGGLSERTVVRRDMVHVLPENVSLEHGALVEPMAVAWRAAKRAGVRSGGTAVVHGAGPIGLGVLLAFRHRDVRVVAVDPTPLRREAAIALGAEVAVGPDDLRAVVRELSGGAGADGAVDAAGAHTTLQAAMGTTRPDGTIVVVAHHSEPIQFTSASLMASELKIAGSMVYDRGDFPAVIDAMASGSYPLDGWVTKIGLDRVVEDGLHPLHRQEASKVLVDLAEG